MNFSQLPTDIIDRIFLQLTIDELDRLLLLLSSNKDNEIWQRLIAAKYSSTIITNLLKEQLETLEEPNLHNKIEYSTILSTLEFELLLSTLAQLFNCKTSYSKITFILNSNGGREPVHKSFRQLSKLIKDGSLWCAKSPNSIYLYLEPIPYMAMIEEYLELQNLNTIFFNFLLRHYRELEQTKILNINSGIFFNDSQRIDFDHLQHFRFSKLILTNLKLSNEDELNIPETVIELDISNNKFDDLLKVKLPSSLRRLKVSDNRLRSLPSLPPNLETINVANNRLNNSIFGMIPQSALYLDLSYNPITLLDQRVVNRLKTLNVEGCNLTNYLPDELLNTA